MLGPDLHRGSTCQSPGVIRTAGAPLPGPGRTTSASSRQANLGCVVLYRAGLSAAPCDKLDRCERKALFGAEE
jgi:hypothetical protein